MQRLILQFSPVFNERIRIAAERHGVAMTEFARQALDSHMAFLALAEAKTNAALLEPSPAKPAKSAVRHPWQEILDVAT